MCTQLHSFGDLANARPGLAPNCAMFGFFTSCSSLVLDALLLRAFFADPFAFDGDSAMTSPAPSLVFLELCGVLSLVELSRFRFGLALLLSVSVTLGLSMFSCVESRRFLLLVGVCFGVDFWLLAFLTSA